MALTPIVAGALLVVAFVWGSAFPMIKLGLEDFSAPHFTLLRHLVASLTYLPLLLVFRAKLRPARRDLPYFALLGMLGFFIYHLALNYGSERVSAGAASLIIATAPAMTAIIAAFMLRERLPLFGWVGSVIAFAGLAAIVMGDSAGLGQMTGGGLNGYAWFIVIAAAATAFFSVLQRPMFARYRPLEVAAFATWAGTVPMLVFVQGLGDALAAASPTGLGAAVYNGVFPSAIAYTLFAFALSRTPVTVVTAWLYMVPLFGLLAAWLLLGEVPTVMTAVGGVIAVLGVVIVNVAKRRDVMRAARVTTGAASAPARRQS